MRKLVGGDYLLDLTPIELEESEDGETYTNITNKEIIEQLTNLKKFVPNPSMVKPVWVKLINGETDEIVVVRGEFKVVDADEFEIVVAIDGYKLKIHIEFTQALNENNDPIDDWYIDTNDAKYLFTSNVQNIDAITSSGDLKSVKADEIIENMTGYSFSQEIVENLNIESIYAGVCKNGNKLTFVYFAKLTKIGNIIGNQTICTFTIPTAIYNKLYSIQFGQYSALNMLNIRAYKAFTEYVDTSGYIEKTGGKIAITMNAFANFVENTTYTIRIEQTFLLSDNLIPEQAGE